MNKVIFIAEAGINHASSLDIAKELCVIARAANADYVKFQKREPRLCTPKDQWDKSKKTPFGEMSYIQYKDKIEFGYDEYAEIDKLCRKIGLEWSCSVWDIPSAKFMIQFAPSLIKIPSAKITDLELVEYCAKAFKHSKLVMSRGMSNKNEIDAAVEVIRNHRKHNNYLLHTNSTYPSELNELNLKCILTLKELYPDFHIGYSGHENRVFPSVVAAALGAEMIERHFCKNRYDNAWWIGDIKASLEPQGLIGLTNVVDHLDEIMGDGEIRVYDSELPARKKLRGY